jgi:uncharacterized delta-60 repeat protein
MKTRAQRRRRPVLDPLEGRALLTAGVLDTTYGGTGQVVTSPGNVEFLEEGLTVQSDLQTVVVGMQSASENYPFNTAIVRYNADGSLDTSFGSGGVVSLATASTVPYQVGSDSVAIQPDGKIVAATNATTYKYTPPTKKTPASYTETSSSMMVLRLNADGSLDTSFGNGGEAVVSIPNAPFEVSGGVAILSGGQIVVAGSNQGTYAGPEFVVARLTSSGALDTTFGPNGQGYNDVSVSPGNNSQQDGVNALGVDASGNILVGGYSSNASGSAYSFQVARYTPAGLLDTSFANQGVFDLANAHGARGVDGIAVQPDGHIILGLAALPTPAKPGVLRLNSDGSIDTSFGSNGYFDEVNATPYDSVAVQPDGKVVIGMTYGTSPNFKVLVDRLLPGGTLDPSFGSGGTMSFVPQSPNVGEPKGIVIGPDGKITGAEQADNSGGFPEVGTFRLLNDITSNTAALPAGSSGPAVMTMALTPDLVSAALDGTDLGGVFLPLSKRNGLLA